MPHQPPAASRLDPYQTKKRREFVFVCLFVCFVYRTNPPTAAPLRRSALFLKRVTPSTLCCVCVCVWARMWPLLFHRVRLSSPQALSVGPVCPGPPRQFFYTLYCWYNSRRRSVSKSIFLTRRARSHYSRTIKASDSTRWACERCMPGIAWSGRWYKLFYMSSTTY